MKYDGAAKKIVRNGRKSVYSGAADAVNLPDGVCEYSEGDFRSQFEGIKI